VAIEGIFYVHIYVSDLARAKRFYGEALGWKLETDEPHVAGFRFGSGYLVVGSDSREASERRYAGGMHVAVRVDDLAAQHARLETRGVAVSPIRAQQWGDRDFEFSDPDGQLWVFAQPG
jgi:catechol 2,3-dioxygenase-like lactoylglutathione lyase family enzyme